MYSTTRVERSVESDAFQKVVSGRSPGCTWKYL